MMDVQSKSPTNRRRRHTTSKAPSIPNSRYRVLSAHRALWLVPIFALGLFADLARDVYLQQIHAPYLREQGRMRYLRRVTVPADRGIITAANGTPLAVNVPAVTLWADPQVLDKHRNRWPVLANTLHLSLPALQNRIDSGGADFAYLLRQASPALGKQVTHLHLAGVGVRQTSRSFFPLGAAATPLIGLVNQAHQGATGMELSYNNWLRGHPGKETVIIDAKGQVLHVVHVSRVSHAGHAIHLTINPQFQYWAYQALTRSLHRFHAENGSAVLMNVRTGAILAMVSAPSCNPNAKGSCISATQYVNNAVHQAFEPGSVMKPFAIAAALASHSVSPTEKFNVWHPLWVGGYPITDDVPHHILNIEHILKYSSCIGTAKIALKTPKRLLYRMYKSVGFGRAPRLGLPGETTGIFPPWQTWGIARHATISIGYGESVTTLQLAAAYAAIANGGTYIAPRLFLGQKIKRKRVMPVWVANDLRRWLESVARPGGTGILAAIPGYHVAGKTGTANMVRGNDSFFHHRTNATFVGFAPGNHPDLVMAVSLRGSTYSWNFGGIEAAPVFRFTMRRALLQSDIPPQCNIGGKFLQIRVPAGSDLHELALRYDSTTKYLMQVNHLQNPADIEAGQLLKVPMPLGEKDFCRVQSPAVTRAQAEIWSEGGG
jgi:cell division protein FtsI (penicillin-binding protein 3)